MKILHTADWHLGATLGKEKRTDEFRRALDWLVGVIRERQVRCVIVAGDIFNTPDPPNSALELYFGFLKDAAEAGARDIVVIAGNHDSPSFLEAPKPLLERLNVHVYARAATRLEDHLIVLQDDSGRECVHIAAIPNLRESDVRTVSEGEGFDDQKLRFNNAVTARYREICTLAKTRRPDLPLIATAHLMMIEKHVTRDMLEIVGSVANVGAEDFPPEIDYLALGHLHEARTAGGKTNFRYSGSLLPMDFRQAATSRKVLLLDTGDLSHCEEITTPVFQRIETVEGDLETIEKAIAAFKLENTEIWLQAIHTGAFNPALFERVMAFCEGSSVVPLICRNLERNPAVPESANGEESLEELSPKTVFERLLDTQKDLDGDRRKALTDAFDEAYFAVTEGDVKS